MKILGEAAQPGEFDPFDRRLRVAFRIILKGELFARDFLVRRGLVSGLYSFFGLDAIAILWMAETGTLPAFMLVAQFEG